MPESIRNIITAIKLFDDIEAVHVADILAWIDSGAGLYRLTKPATPPKHLVSYAAIVDTAKHKMLLLEHVNAGLLLPAGGHVELDEDPKLAAERELREELSLQARFIMDEPFFITQAITVNIGAGHTDVSLWYLLSGDSESSIAYDKNEFNGYAWYSFEDILAMSESRLDPHCQRFVRKLLAYLQKV